MLLKKNPKNGEVGKMEGPVITIEQRKSFVVEAEKTLKELFAQQVNNGSKEGP